MLQIIFNKIWLYNFLILHFVKWAGLMPDCFLFLELVEDGIPFNEIIQKYYPNLKIKDIKACLKYAIEL